ncbi:hypothetical protein K525DRAFT_212103, partial [Schizophyllum commune Loenen D]
MGAGDGHDHLAGDAAPAAEAQNFPPIATHDFPRPARPPSVLDMPTPGTRQAPKTFRGAFYEVERFVEHYDRLLRQYNVRDPYDKCHAILQYCSQHVAEFIMSTRQYAHNDWEGLRAAILKYYNAERVHLKHRPADVVAFVTRAQKKMIENLTQWNQYYTRFVSRAGQLVNSGKMTEADEATYFWLGIHPNLRAVLENRIMAREPFHDLSEAYSMDLICAVAEEHFQRQKFTTMRPDAD